jgi:hypothetical protein
VRFIFWTAVLIEVIGLGIAWSAWRAVSDSSLALLIAVPASAIGVAAAIVSGRILTVVTRESRRACDTQG